MIGNAGRADRLSLMTMESPPFLLVSGNPVATLVDAQSIKDGTTIYELTMEDGNVLGAYGFFVERPDLSVVNPIGKDVFTGRRAPLTTFNTGTNTITISGP
jgi:hypothetical protein